MAPEVLMGGGPATPADVFTAAVLAYQMVTGALPFRAPNLPALIGQMLRAAPAAPRDLQPGVPATASAAIVRALAANPADRFADASAFAAALFAEV